MASEIWVDYNNGVLYFERDGFGNTMSKYLEEHPGVKIKFICEDIANPGYTKGYYVIVEVVF